MRIFLCHPSCIGLLREISTVAFGGLGRAWPSIKPSRARPELHHRHSSPGDCKHFLMELLRNTRIRELVDAKRPLVWVDQNATVGQCAELLRRNNILSIPVYDTINKKVRTRSNKKKKEKRASYSSSSLLASLTASQSCSTSHLENSRWTSTIPKRSSLTPKQSMLKTLP